MGVCVCPNIVVFWYLINEVDSGAPASSLLVNGRAGTDEVRYICYMNTDLYEQT